MTITLKIRVSDEVYADLARELGLILKLPGDASRDQVEEWAKDRVLKGTPGDTHLAKTAKNAKDAAPPNQKNV